MDKEFVKLAGMLAKIAYEVHDNSSIDEGLREMLLELWRQFDYYNQFDN